MRALQHIKLGKADNKDFLDKCVSKFVEVNKPLNFMMFEVIWYFLCKYNNKYVPMETKNERALFGYLKKR